jgi:uncharacterized Zn-binding protein involved in type VI secretion
LWFSQIGVQACFHPSTIAGSRGAVAVSMSQSDTTALVGKLAMVAGRSDGSIHVIAPGDITLAGGAVITGDLLVPGSPSVRVNGDSAVFGGVIVVTAISTRPTIPLR